MVVRGVLALASVDISRLRLLDLNGDGAADFIELSLADENTGAAVPCKIHLNQGNGTFAPPIPGPAVLVSRPTHPPSPASARILLISPTRSGAPR